jgi:hypothetical protein
LVSKKIDLKYPADMAFHNSSLLEMISESKGEFNTVCEYLNRKGILISHYMDYQLDLKIQEIIKKYPIFSLFNSAYYNLTWQFRDDMAILELEPLFRNLLSFRMLLERSKITTLDGKTYYPIENKQLKLSESDATLPLYSAIFKSRMDHLIAKLPGDRMDAEFEEEINSIYTKIFSPTRCYLFTDFLERLAWFKISRVFKDFSISPKYRL